MGWWNKMARDHYTEYGYRGAKELQEANKQISMLNQKIIELTDQVQNLENRCNELQAKASLPKR